MTGRENLSSMFIAYVKVLFDILDKDRSGFVKLSDIECHWEGSECLIPRNIVIQSLTQVATPDGRLSFETFISGLGRALTSWKSNGSASNSSSENGESLAGSAVVLTHKSVYRSCDGSGISTASQRSYVHKGSGERSGLLEPVESNLGSVSSGADADSLALWQNERLPAAHTGGNRLSQKTKG